MEIKTVSQRPDLDERRVLMMTFQALLNVEALGVIAQLNAGERG
mgnify:CR=1 FL=1